MLRWAIVLLLMYWSTSLTQLPPQDYPFNATLNNQLALAKWRKVGEDRLELEITAPTTGWFGFGFSPNGGMRGADILVGWIDDNGKAHIEDRYATDFAEPLLDKQQDWTLVAAGRQDNNLVFRVSRKLDTCDDQDIPVTGDTMRLMYASNPAIPTKTVDAYHLSKHTSGTTGVHSLYFFDGSQRVPGKPSPGETLVAHKFLVTEFVVPKNDTTYLCEVMNFPDLGSKELHMIGFGPAIQKGNEDLVHHLLLYICSDAVNATSPQKRSFVCEEDVEAAQADCSSLLGGWARGGEYIFLPHDVAFSVKNLQARGGYLLMQMHYDNPRLEERRKDASGLEMIFTDKARQNNAGSTRFGSGGLDWTVAVPPLEPQWTISAECPAACTAKKLPKDGIKVVLAALHTHLLGTKVVTHHLRNGKELPPLHKDDNYDSNYQQFKSFKTPVVILPNDSIIVDCVYSSVYPTNRNFTTFGGESTRSEMCLVFAFYYPAVDFASCTGVVSPRELAKVYGWQKDLNSTKGAELQAFISGYDWSQANRTKLRKYIRDGPQIYGCMGEDWEDPTSFGVLPKISDYIPYKEPSVCSVGYLLKVNETFKIPIVQLCTDYAQSYPSAVESDLATSKTLARVSDAAALLVQECAILAMGRPGKTMQIIKLKVLMELENIRSIAMDELGKGERLDTRNPLYYPFLTIFELTVGSNNNFHLQLKISDVFENDFTNGKGRFLSFRGSDESGDIRGVIFNEDIEKNRNLFINGVTLSIGKPQVKLANPLFNATYSSKYQLFVVSDTTVICTVVQPDKV